jgi:histone H1/5
MGSAKKYATAKSSTVKKADVVNKTHPAHPSWADMIKECIVAHPDDARFGVSRPTIKKFIEAHYAVEINPAAASQLNRAIAHGADKGVFVLPKGSSGKVKLAVKARSDATKENSKPAAKVPKGTSKKAALPNAAPTRKPMSSNRKPTPIKRAAPTRPTAVVKTKAAASKRNTTKVKATTAVKSSSAAKKKAVPKETAASAKKPVAKKAGREKKPSAKAAATAELKAKAAATKPKSTRAPKIYKHAPNAANKPGSKVNTVSKKV